MKTGRKALTPAQIATLPPERRAETLKKRKTREKAAARSNVVKLEAAKRLAAVPVAPSPPGEVVFGLDPADLRARAMYLDLRDRMRKAGRWAGEATHGILLSYVKATVAIEGLHAVMVGPALWNAQKGAAAALDLATLPVDKPTASVASDRFGGSW